MTNSKPAVKIEKILIGKKSKTLSYKRERVPGPEWSTASHFFLLPLTITKTKNKEESKVQTVMYNLVA